MTHEWYTSEFQYSNESELIVEYNPAGGLGGSTPTIFPTIQFQIFTIRALLLATIHL